MRQVKKCAASRLLALHLVGAYTYALTPMSAALGTDALGRDVDIMIGTGQRDGMTRNMNFFRIVM